jgi:N-acetylneuraminic acid mutarotase
MIRSTLSKSALAFVLAAVGVTGPTAWAHFPWLATDDAGHALLFFGESPADRTYHTPDAVAEAKVVLRKGDAEPAAMELAAVETDDFVGQKSEQAVPKGGVLESEIRYGVYHGMLLDYYAKHISAGATAKSGLKLNATPRMTDDGVQVAVRWDGKPLANASVTLIDGEGEQTEAETDAEGVAKFEAPKPGLIGFLIARMDNGAKGDVEGEKYTSAGAYGTVTMVIGESEKDAKSPTAALTPLPEAVASFGAAVADGWLYVYGGHTGEEHEHTIDNLSAHFRRIKLDGGAAWEELPMQTPLQGLPLVSHGGKLYRVGGLNFRNKPEQDEDMHSVAEFASYDPATQQWAALAPLPEARSSHDAVVIGDKIYVVGGWTLDGESRGKWLETAWSFDLANPQAGWQAVAKPTFKRRALAVASWNGKLVALGGMDDANKISLQVDALDVVRGQWSELPSLPESKLEDHETFGSGFGVSAWNLGGKLVASGADGVVHELADDGSAWQTVGELATGRFFHRLMPGAGSSLLAVAGANMDEGHLASIESFLPGKAN